MYEIGKLPTLHLGRQGERNTTHIQINVTPWMERWPTAGITLIVIRPREDEDAAYIASTEWIHDEETGTYVLSWIPNSGDTAIAGRGVAEVRAVVRGENGEDVIKKSVTVRTSIAPAIEESSDPPGPTQEGWISTLTALAGTVVNGAEQVAADKAQVHDDLTNMEELVDYAEHLDPIQVAIDVQTVIDSKDAAVAAASAASGSATAAEGSADSAADSASAASGSASAASGSATAAAGSADNAAGSATAAAGSASAAELHARNALDSSSYANARATAAASSASEASGSATAAATSATNAQSSADAAEQSAQDAATAAADSVKVTSQSWSTTQQAQARSNIGATTDADLAIVANGNTHAAIESGQFVYVRNHSTLAEGLYKATAAIGTNAALSTSNLTADTSGGLNDLQGQVATLNSNLRTVITSGSLKTFAVNTAEGFTCFRYNNAVTDTPCDYGHGYVVHYGQNIRIVVFNMTAIAEFTAYSSNSGSTWSNWESTSYTTAALQTSKGTLENWSRVDKSGNIVTVTLKMTMTAAVNAWNEIATIPIGFRPHTSHNFNVAMQNGSTLKFDQLQILDTGAIRISSNLASGTVFGFTVSYAQ